VNVGNSDRYQIAERCGKPSSRGSANADRVQNALHQEASNSSSNPRSGVIAAPVYALKCDGAGGCGTWLSRLVRHQREKKLADGDFRQWVERQSAGILLSLQIFRGEVYGGTLTNFDNNQKLIQEKWLERIETRKVAA